MGQFPIFDIRNGTLERYYGCDSHVVIPRGVTAIGADAFNNYRGRKYVEHVTIPEGVTGIGESAFYKCSELRRVDFPKGLEKIGAFAFYCCTELRELTLPEGLTDIGEGAFHSCRYAAEIRLPEGLLSIGKSAFSGCWHLSGLQLPESLTRIGAYAFSECWRLAELEIPEAVRDIGVSPFAGCTDLTDLRVSGRNSCYKSAGSVIFSRDGRTLIAGPGRLDGSLNIPEGVTEIRIGALRGCKNLEEIRVPQGVTVLPEMAFSGCEALRRVTLPDGLKAIGEHVFAGCGSLAEIRMPDGVAEIGRGAFKACAALTELMLPKGLTSVSEELGGGCKSLERLSIPEGVTAVGEWAFIGCSRLTELSLPTSLQQIEFKAFSGCSALEWLTLPPNVKIIGGYAFEDCTALQDVILPEYLEEIRRDAFLNCRALAEVWIPDCDGIALAFRACTALEAFLVPLTSRRFRGSDGAVLSRDGRRFIAYPPGRRCRRYDVPETVREISGRAFHEAPIELIVLPGKLESCSVTALDTEGDHIPFVAHSIPDLMYVLTRPVYLGSPGDLAPNQIRKAVEGFAYAWHAGMPEIAPWAGEYRDLVRRNYDAWEKASWNNPDLIRLLMDLRVLKARTAGNMIRKYTKARREDLCTELQTYLQSLSGEEGTDERE